MKAFFLVAIILLGTVFAFGQNEEAPVIEKDISYKDWNYKNALTGGSMNLRDHSRGKKLVMLVYFAAWCPNWKHQAPLTQKLYEKYKDKGLEIVGVAEYDTIEATKASMALWKITFPVVVESESRDQFQKTLHYDYRKAVGDTRKWGSPWNLFLQPELFEKKGDVLVKKANLVNGELIEADVEKFIQDKLGLAGEKKPEEKKAVSMTEKKVEACSDERVTAFVKP